MDKGESSAEDIEKLKKMVPKAYQKYIESKYPQQLFNWLLLTISDQEAHPEFFFVYVGL